MYALRHRRGLPFRGLTPDAGAACHFAVSRRMPARLAHRSHAAGARL
jgi:hypothetical protein